MVKAREDGGRTLALDILARAEELSPVGVVVTLNKAQVMRPCEGVCCSSWLLANLGMGLGCWVLVSIAQAFYARGMPCCRVAVALAMTVLLAGNARCLTAVAVTGFPLVLQGTAAG